MHAGFHRASAQRVGAYWPDESSPGSISTRRRWFTGRLSAARETAPPMFVRLLAVLLCLLLAAAPVSAAPAHPECIAPASPGGGFDLTCRLAQKALLQAGLLPAPLRISYVPGGVGAVAFNAMVSQRPADGNIIHAWSSGSLLNLAQKKFGRYDEGAVRWLAAVGTSYGAIAVRSDSPYHSLADLVNALKSNPRKVTIGSSGTVGGQDWMQAAMIARIARIDPRNLRYVALEGGGEIATALLGGHIEVASTDIADSVPHILAGRMRILAVFAEQRLPDELAGIPTAREQGYDIVWPVVRGFYIGPRVSDADYAWWKSAFEQLLVSDAFADARRHSELLPFAMTGDELQAWVHQRVASYRQLVEEFGLPQ